MKKILLALSSLLLALTLCFPAMAESAQAEIWMLTEITANDATFDARLANLVVTLILNPDGACTLVSDKAVSSVAIEEVDGTLSIPTTQQTYPGVWVDSDAGILLTLSEEPLLFAHDGSRLCFETDGDLYFFEHYDAVPYEPEPIPEDPDTAIAADEPAAEQEVFALSNVPLSQFVGEWYFVFVEFGDELLTSDDLGESYLITLEEEGGQIHIIREESSSVYTLAYEMAELEDIGTVLFGCIPDPDNSGKHMRILPLLLRPDGTLLWTDVIDDTNVSYHFIRFE